MFVSEYDKFVRTSDQFADRPLQERIDIAMYGLSAEIGSVIATIKKKLMRKTSDSSWNKSNKEMVEELGDSLWYGFLYSHLVNKDKYTNIFYEDIKNLRKEITARNSRSKRIAFALGEGKRKEFLRRSKIFPASAGSISFNDYQDLAHLTARTSDRLLVEVCLSVLLQLSAELFRRKLPVNERELNQNIKDRDVNIILGEIAWHLAAISTVFGLKFDYIAQENMKKISDRFRLTGKQHTPFHDTGYPEQEQLPRKFEVSFIEISDRRSRMYIAGKRFGDDLTDNTYDDDGYRYHDIMHLANATKLGWSPVLRDLLDKKRKSNPKIDEVEDGARARIVEEAIIKAIHSEGQRISDLSGIEIQKEPVRLFENRSDISFSFLKLIKNLSGGHEVKRNQFWEWEEAILDGFKIFYQLHSERQGTVYVDLETRSIEFRPEVFIDVNGKVSSVGSTFIDPLKKDIAWSLVELSAAETKNGSVAPGIALRLIAQKRAILDALNIAPVEQSTFESIQITELSPSAISVKASGGVKAAMWSRGIVCFRTSLNITDGGVFCTALGISDD